MKKNTENRLCCHRFPYEKKEALKILLWLHSSPICLYSDRVMHRFEVVVASRVTSTADKRIRSRAINYERIDTWRKSVLGSGVPVEIKFADVTAHRYVAGTRTILSIG
jgi:hypothetical protein